MEDWRAGIDHWPGSVGPFEVDARRTALLIIDMQNYYVREDGGMTRLLAARFPDILAYLRQRLAVVIPNQQRLLAFFREHGLRRVFVTVGSELEDGSDQFRRRYERDRRRAAQSGTGVLLHRGSYQHQIIEELSPRRDELVLNKNSSGAFNSTAIDQFLRNMGIETLVIGGLATNLCVETTARDAADRGYQVFLVEDACATFEHEAHVATLRTFARGYGKVGSTAEILEFLSQAVRAQGPITYP